MKTLGSVVKKPVIAGSVPNQEAEGLWIPAFAGMTVSWTRTT